jgi:hypothetical protein
METLKEYYYTYYSYEEWGRGYFGSRGCKCLPEEDINYLGSSKDKTFRPTQKIILKDDYATREEAYADEIILQQHYKVVENPHFANRAYQTSTKFYYTDGSMGGKKAKELGVGVHSLSKEELSENGKKGGNKVKEFGVGIFGMDEDKKMEARIRGAKKAGKDNKKLKRGIFAFGKSERIEVAKMGGNKCKELKVGIHALTAEERSNNSKKSVKKTNSQRWMCTETGFITNSGALTRYQQARGIDTSKRVILE